MDDREQEIGLPEGCGCLVGGIVGLVAVPGLMFYGGKVTGCLVEVCGGGLGGIMGAAIGLCLAVAAFVAVRKLLNNL